jgi:hypothetical protein
MQISGRVARVVAAICIISPMVAAAQNSTLRVVGSDTMPVMFASVSVEGGSTSITDERGVVSLGGTRHKTLTVEVRRIGYSPWFGKIIIPDTAAVIMVTLPRIVQQLAGVNVTGERIKSRLEQAGFYDRWMQRQRGALSATFIGPEELDKRHPGRLTDMLNGLNGVTIVHADNGAMCAKGLGSTCFMAVLVDGNPLRNTPLSCPGGAVQHIGRGQGPQLNPGQDLNGIIDANDVSAIEVYTRSGNMPISLQATDNICGTLAIWTGARK